MSCAAWHGLSSVRITTTSRVSGTRTPVATVRVRAPTTAFTDRTSSLPGWRSVHSIAADAASGTERVLVSKIGVSISPSSFTCVLPMNLPKPLAT